MNHVTSKKELFVTNVKVFQHLTVVEKRDDLDVSGFLNLTSIWKPFTSVAGFLKPFTNVAMWQEFGISLWQDS